MPRYSIRAYCEKHGLLKWRDFSAEVFGESGRDYGNLDTYLVVTCKKCNILCMVELVE